MLAVERSIALALWIITLPLAVSVVAEVEIEARRPGNTIVELVYARPNEWDLGNDPQKVIQIFVHIE